MTTTVTNRPPHTLIILLGPTGVGKTELSLRIAAHFHTFILSADSRQLYQELPIGTAAPTPEQLARVRHYFVGTLSLADYYSASRFEEETLALLDELFLSHPVAVMTGGSMMYIDAVTKGIDDIPTVTPDIRAALWQQYEAEGLAPILAELKEKDPQHYAEVDRQNYKRVIHAVEICRLTGRPYSSFRTHTRKPRPFRIIQIGLRRDREELYDRINRRVDQMMDARRSRRENQTQQPRLRPQTDDLVQTRPRNPLVPPFGRGSHHPLHRRAAPLSTLTS